MVEKWMQAESEREEKAGTKGSFSRAAKRAGKSTSEFAQEKKSASGKMGRKARMAMMYAKGRAARKAKSRGGSRR